MWIKSPSCPYFHCFLARLTKLTAFKTKNFNLHARQLCHSILSMYKVYLVQEVSRQVTVLACIMTHFHWQSDFSCVHYKHNSNGRPVAATARRNVTKLLFQTELQCSVSERMCQIKPHSDSYQYADNAKFNFNIYTKYIWRTLTFQMCFLRHITYIGAFMWPVVIIAP
jgi:hypothetical protein